MVDTSSHFFQGLYNLFIFYLILYSAKDLSIRTARVPARTILAKQKLNDASRWRSDDKMKMNNSNRPERCHYFTFYGLFGCCCSCNRNQWSGVSMIILYYFFFCKKYLLIRFTPAPLVASRLMLPRDLQPTFLECELMQSFSRTCKEFFVFSEYPHTVATRFYRNRSLSSVSKHWVSVRKQPMAPVLPKIPYFTDAQFQHKKKKKNLPKHQLCHV